MHRDDYGDYVIGFRGEWQANHLRRLRYVNEQKKPTSFLTPQLSSAGHGSYHHEVSEVAVE